MYKWQADDGTQIHYEIYGASDSPKPVLLLLPGFLGAVENQWRRFVRPLSEYFQLILMDFRGHGRSETGPEQLNLSLLLRDVNGLLDALQVETVHVAGYSLGGYCGMLLAYNQPQRVSSLVVHGTKFYWTRESVAQMQAQMDPEKIAERVPGYADQLVQDHGARRWRDLVRQTAVLVQQMHDEGLSEKNLGGIYAPTLVSVGERDELVALPEAQRLARKLPDGRLIVLPGVRHPFNSLVSMPLIPMMIHFLQGK